MPRSLYLVLVMSVVMFSKDLSDVDYVIDAIDNVTAKLLLIEEAKKKGVPIISSLGTGNKLDNTKFQIADISKTHTCPLAKVMRKEIKDRRWGKVKVIMDLLGLGK